MNHMTNHTKGVDDFGTNLVFGNFSANIMHGNLANTEYSYTATNFLSFSVKTGKKQLIFSVKNTASHSKPKTHA